VKQISATLSRVHSVPPTEGTCHNHPARQYLTADGI